MSYSNFEELAQAGVRAFTNDGLGVLSDQVMDDAFARLENIPVPLLQHAEFLGHGGSLAPGSVQRQVGAKPYPSEPEWKMVERDLAIAPPSSEGSLSRAARVEPTHAGSGSRREARRLECHGRSDAPPSVLQLRANSAENKSFKMNPPIRAKRTDRWLFGPALADGTLDFVATDHAPHEPSMKTGSFDTCAFGTIGMETTLGVLDRWIEEGPLDARAICRCFQLDGRRAFLSLPPEFGEFKVGERFHGILSRRRIIPADSVYSRTTFPVFPRTAVSSVQSLPGRLRRALHGELVHTFN